jgi:outer membrane protein assembly factor BamA
MEAQHDVDFSRGIFRFGGNRGWLKHLFVGIGGQDYQPKVDARFVDADSTVKVSTFPLSLSSRLSKASFSQFEIGLKFDTRDNPIFPTRGFWGALYLQNVQNNDDKSIEFGRVILDARYYHKTRRGAVFAANVRAGSTEAPAAFYQRFYLGGANSLRGYSERRLTPIGYGTDVFLSRFELRMPFNKRKPPEKSASGVLFFDAGKIGQVERPDLFDEWYRSAGVGLRFRLPVLGTTRIDLAFPLEKIEEENVQLHISLGHTF